MANAIHLIEPPYRPIILAVQTTSTGSTINYQNCKYLISVNNPEKAETTLLWTVYIATKLWATNWNEAKVKVFSTDPKVITMINTGASRIIKNMTIARNIWLQSATYNFVISATLVTGITDHNASTCTLQQKIIDSANNLDYNI